MHLIFTYLLLRGICLEAGWMYLTLSKKVGCGCLFIWEVETEEGIAAVLNLISLSSYFGCICKIWPLDPEKDFLATLEFDAVEGNGGITREGNPFMSPVFSSTLNSHLAFSMRHWITCVFWIRLNWSLECCSAAANE